MDFTQELKTEYNQLRSQAAESAKKIILRCAEILVELEHPVQDICSKLSEDLPYSDGYIRRVLPEKYKQESKARFAEQGPQNVQPRTQLIAALESVVKVADTLKNLAAGLLRKMMENKDKYTALNSSTDVAQLQHLTLTLKGIESDLAEISEYTDDRVIITKLEQSVVRLEAGTKTFRQIAGQYHVSAKRISQIARQDDS